MIANWFSNYNCLNYTCDGQRGSSILHGRHRDGADFCCAPQQRQGGNGFAHRHGQRTLRKLTPQL